MICVVYYNTVKCTNPVYMRWVRSGGAHCAEAAVRHQGRAPDGTRHSYPYGARQLRYGTARPHDACCSVMMQKHDVNGQ